MTPSRLSLTASALLLALVLGLAGCSKSPERHLADGKAFVQKADYRSAAIELKSALQAQPANLEARLLLAKAHYELGAYADAEKELEKARQLGANPVQTLPLQAMNLVRMGKHQDVIKLALPDIGFPPSALATLHTARASALLALGNRPEGERMIALARQADASLPDLLMLQALLALGDKHKEQAAEFVELALKHHPGFNQALFLKGSMLDKDGKTAEAVKVYQQILANDPKEFRAHLAIAEGQLKARQFDAADKTLQAAEKGAGKHPQVRFARGVLELQRGKLSDASTALQDVLRVAPDHLPSALAYAMAAFGQGQYEQSLKFADKVLAASPDNLLAATLVAGSQLKLGNVAETFKVLNPLLAKHPDNARLLAMAGEAHLLAKDYAKAMGYLDKAAELDPDNAFIKTRQAAGHLATGAGGDAIADLEKAVALSDKPGQADVTLVMLHLRNKEFDKALQAIKLLEKKLPTNPVTHNLRAAALLGKQDNASARNALEQALALQPTFFPAAVNLARLDMQEGKPDAARKRFEAVLAKDKANLRAMLALAELALVQKQDARYLEWMDKAIKAEPKAIATYQQLVNFLLASKDSRKALAVANQAINANPDNLGALNLLGSTQKALGDFAGALQTYTRMVQKEPESPQAHVFLAQAQLDSQQTNAARASLKRALELKPGFARAQDALLRLEMREKNPDAALAIARQIQAQLPGAPLGFEREGDIQIAQKRFPQAVRGYEQALGKGGGTASFIKLNHALVLAGNIKASEQQISEWLRKHPGDWTARLYAGEWYLRQKRIQNAIAQYEEILKGQPNNVTALNNLAALYQQEKNPKALATAEQVNKLAPDAPQIQDTLGWILIEQGKMARGLELLAKAAAKAPENATIRYHHAIALLRNGRQQEAKRELVKALELDQGFAEHAHARQLLKNL